MGGPYACFHRNQHGASAGCVPQTAAHFANAGRAARRVAAPADGLPPRPAPRSGRLAHVTMPPAPGSSRSQPMSTPSTLEPSQASQTPAAWPWNEPMPTNIRDEQIEILLVEDSPDD